MKGTEPKILKKNIKRVEETLSSSLEKIKIKETIKKTHISNQKRKKRGEQEPKQKTNIKKIKINPPKK